MPTPRYTMYMPLRPTVSDVHDQTNRPAMLNSDSSPTNPAAAPTATDDFPALRKKSWIIGLACSRMPIPAVTLQNSTIHSSQKDRVRIALDAETEAVVTSRRAATDAGSKPAGRQS